MDLSKIVRFTNRPDGSIQANVIYQDSHKKVAQIFAGGDTKKEAAENLVKWLITLGLLENKNPEPKKPILRVIK